MKIEINFESSIGHHSEKISLEEIRQMAETDTLQLTNPVGHEVNHKTITISGTNEELEAMAQALLNART